MFLLTGVFRGSFSKNVLIGMVLLYGETEMRRERERQRRRRLKEKNERRQERRRQTTLTEAGNKQNDSNRHGEAWRETETERARNEQRVAF